MSMTKKNGASAGVLAGATLALVGAGTASGAVITQYSFSATSPTPSTTEAATTGTGTATALGMTNAYTYANSEGPGSTDGSNVTLTPGTANPSFSEYTYRIVGNSNKAGGGAGNANGWNNAAPNYTQGALFTAGTVGYVPTQLSFDWYSTTQGVANLQVRYTLDGTTFTNLGTDLIATPNDYYGAAAGTPSNTFSLAGLPAGATNDPNFAVELVSVRPVSTDANYTFTLTPGDGNYASAAATAAAPADYNNSSGNWRFDNVTVSGTPTTAVPEPASVALLATAGLTLVGRRKAR